MSATQHTGSVRSSFSASTLLRDVEKLVPEFQRRLSDPVPAFPSTELKALAACGALRAALPASMGGLGFGVDPVNSAALLTLLKETGRSNLVIGRIFEGHVNALLLIHHYGTPQQLEAAASDVIERNCVFGVWNTGPAKKLSASRTPEGSFVLSGGKTFATGAGEIERAIVTGEFEGAWRMFLVPLDQIKYEVDPNSWVPLGMEASASYSVDFSGVELDGQAAIGAPNEYYREPFFTAGAFRFSAVHLGGAQALFEFCTSFLKEVHYEKDPHQLHRLGRMAVAVESGHNWLAQAAKWLETESGCAECLLKKARMLRIATGEICTRVMNLVETSVGARGMEGRRPFARMLRDLQMYIRQAGTDNAITSVGEAAIRESL